MHLVSSAKNISAVSQPVSNVIQLATIKRNIELLYAAVQCVSEREVTHCLNNISHCLNAELSASTNSKKIKEDQLQLNVIT